MDYQDLDHCKIKAFFITETPEHFSSETTSQASWIRDHRFHFKFSKKKNSLRMWTLYESEKQASGED